MNRSRASLLLLCISLCTAGLMMLWPVPDAQKLQTAEIISGDLVHSLLLKGTVQPSPLQACISPKNGRISAVYAAAGQRVRKGDLLFALDTDEEERMLASLYAGMQQLRWLPEEIGVSSAALEMLNTEKQLVSAIQASQIRASADGVVQAVYVQDGDLVAQSAVLGAVHGREMEIAAVAHAADLGQLAPGTAAVGKRTDGTSVPLVLFHMKAPENGLQQLLFRCAEQVALRNGERVEIEMITDVIPDRALVPLSAVDAENCIWFPEEGVIRRQPLSDPEYSRFHAAVPREWIGRSVVLHPDRLSLKDGMPAKEAGGE